MPRFREIEAGAFSLVLRGCYIVNFRQRRLLSA